MNDKRTRYCSQPQGRPKRRIRATSQSAPTVLRKPHAFEAPISSIALLTLEPHARRSWSNRHEARAAIPNTAGESHSIPGLTHPLRCRQVHCRTGRLAVVPSSFVYAALPPHGTRICQVLHLRLAASTSYVTWLSMSSVRPGVPGLASLDSLGRSWRAVYLPCPCSLYYGYLKRPPNILSLPARY